MNYINDISFACIRKILIQVFWTHYVKSFYHLTYSLNAWTIIIWIKSLHFRFKFLINNNTFWTNLHRIHGQRSPTQISFRKSYVNRSICSLQRHDDLITSKSHAIGTARIDASTSRTRRSEHVQDVWQLRDWNDLDQSCRTNVHRPYVWR